MPPRKRQALAVTAPADLADKQPANADLDNLRAEVATEHDSDDGPKAVPLADTTVRIKAFLDWPVSANEELITGRYTSWARKVLHPDDFKVWVKVDPTNRQLIEFLTDVEKISGLPLGSLITSSAS
jgi:hypothetical protein